MSFLVRVIATLFLTSIAALSHAANALTNPDFATDLSGWNVSAANSASATFDGTSGSPSPGSVHLQSANGDAAQLSQCIAIAGPQHVDLIARQYVAFITPQLAGAALILSSYPNANCAPPALVSITATELTPGAVGVLNGVPQVWDEVAVLNQALPAATVSASVTLYAVAGSGAAADIYYDDVRLQPTASTPVRLQAFGVD